MLALENRTLDSKREMDILDALDEIRTKNSILEKVDTSTILGKIYKNETPQEQIVNIQEKEDAEIAKAIFTDVDGETVKRVNGNEKKNDMKSSTKAQFTKPYSKLQIEKRNLVKLGIKKAIAPKHVLTFNYASDSD
jgi:phage tail tube protein FII